MPKRGGYVDADESGVVGWDLRAVTALRLRAGAIPLDWSALRWGCPVESRP